MRRKIVSIVMASAMVLGLAACGSSGGTTTSSSNGGNDASAADDTTAKSESSDVVEGGSDDDNSLTHNISPACFSGVIFCRLKSICFGIEFHRTEFIAIEFFII